MSTVKMKTYLFIFESVVELSLMSIYSIGFQYHGEKSSGNLDKLQPHVSLQSKNKVQLLKEFKVLHLNKNQYYLNYNAILLFVSFISELVQELIVTLPREKVF